MANYNVLKAAVQEVIRQNGNNEITGNILQQTLLTMIDYLTVGYLYAGIATPSTTPGTPDQNVFYIAAQAGTYSNFGGAVLAEGEVAILRYNGSWTKDETNLATRSAVEGAEVYMYNNLSGYIDPADGKWKGIGTDYRRYSIFPVEVNGGEAIHINGSSNDTSVVAFLSANNPVSNTDAGSLLTVTVAANTDYNGTIPAGTKYVYVLRKSVTDRTPQQFTIGAIDILAYAKDNIFRVVKYIDTTATLLQLQIGKMTPVQNETIISGSKNITAASDILPATEIELRKGDYVLINVSGKGTVWSAMSIYLNGSSADGTMLYINRPFYVPFDIESIRLRIIATQFIASGTVTYSIVRYNFNDSRLMFRDEIRLDSSIHRGYITNGAWANIDTSYRYYKIIDIEGLAGAMDIKANSQASAVVCFLSSFAPVTGSSVGIIGTETTVPAGTTVQLEIPNNAKYLYYLLFSGSDDREPESIYCGTLDLMLSLKKNLLKVANAVNNAQPAQGTSIFDFNPENDVMPRLRNLSRAYRVYGQNPTKECLRLLHCSDFHLQANNMKRLTDFSEKYESFIDDVLHTGDTFSIDLAQTLPTEWNGEWLNVIGNHDATLRIDGQYVIQPPLSSYNKLFAPYISQWGVVQPANAATNGYCYYYKDYEQGFRLIVLDNFTQGSSTDNHWNATQRTWFEATLESARQAGKQVIVAVHYPPFITTQQEGNPFDSIDYEITSNSICNTEIPACVTSFINNGGQFVCWLCGHTHYNKFGINSASYPGQLVIIVPTASITGATVYSDEARAEGDKTQDCFDIIGFDPVAKTIKMMRIGSDYDNSLRKKNTICWDYQHGNLIYVD